MFANPLLGTRVTIIVTPALSVGAVWKRLRFHELSLGMAWRRDGIAKAESRAGWEGGAGAGRAVARSGNLPEGGFSGWGAPPARLRG